jgi:high-affinity nickel-transport protein
MFIAVWAAALIYWRIGNVEDKWTAGMASAPAVAARPPEAAPEPRLAVPESPFRYRYAGAE